MVDQLTWHAVPGRPGRLAARAEPETPRRPLRPGLPTRLLRKPALRAKPGELHDRPTSVAAPGSMTMPPSSPSDTPDLCPSPAPGGLPDRAVGQDAFRRPRPVARVRGAADNRYLPGRFRLDARTTASPASGSTGGTTISVRSPAPVSRKSPTRWNTTTRSPTTPPARSMIWRVATTTGPWCLTVSFTHPHDPYVARRKILGSLRRLRTSAAAGAGSWPMRTIPRMPSASSTPMTGAAFDITDDDIRRSRRAYFANISYLDDKIGELLDARWRPTRQEAIILFVSDHGDMLGERGLWFKMSFFEGSARSSADDCSPGLEPGCISTPSRPSMSPRRCATWPVSAMDEVMPWTDG